MGHRRLEPSADEEGQRLARIARAAPPASSFEGRLQQWRDEQRAAPTHVSPADSREDGDDEDPPVLDDLTTAGDLDVEDDELPDLSEVPEPPPELRRPTRLRNPKYRRVREAAERPATSSSWWAGKSRDEFRRAARDRAVELQSSPAAAKIKTPLNFA